MFLDNLSSECRKLVELIPKSYLAKPPTDSHEDRNLVKLWKKVILHESSNPQELSQDLHNAKMIVTYKKALEYLKFYPEIWYMYASYIQGIDGIEECKKGIVSIKGLLGLNILIICSVQRGIGSDA